MRCVTVVCALAAGGMLLAGLAGPAAADDPAPVRDCRGDVCLRAARPGQPATTHATSGDHRGAPQSVTCAYRPLPADEAAVLTSPAGQRGGWFYRPCQGGDGRTMRQWQGPVWIAAPPPRRPLVDPAVLAREAYGLLPIPVPRLGANPPADGPQLVNLPIWLWVAPDTWGGRTASVSVPGESVTATATAVQVAWSMGDGATMVCCGPGSAYDAKRAAAQQRSSCAYAYRRSSADQPDGRFTVIATTTWTVTWQATGLVQAGGQLPPLRRSAQLRLRVAEGQTLN